MHTYTHVAIDTAKHSKQVVRKELLETKADAHVEGIPTSTDILVYNGARTKNLTGVTRGANAADLSFSASLMQRQT